jgi:hypothetical protein
MLRRVAAKANNQTHGFKHSWARSSRCLGLGSHRGARGETGIGRGFGQGNTVPLRRENMAVLVYARKRAVCYLSSFIATSPVLVSTREPRARECSLVLVRTHEYRARVYSELLVSKALMSSQDNT